MSTPLLNKEQQEKLAEQIADSALNITQDKPELRDAMFTAILLGTILALGAVKKAQATKTE